MSKGFWNRLSEEMALEEDKRVLADIEETLKMKLDPTRPPTESEIKYWDDILKLWNNACDVARKYCPIGEGRSHIDQGIPLMARRLENALKENVRLKAYLRHYYIECAHCKCALAQTEPDVPPHCPGCVVSEDETIDWEEWEEGV